MTERLVSLDLPLGRLVRDPVRTDGARSVELDQPEPEPALGDEPAVVVHPVQSFMLLASEQATDNDLASDEPCGSLSLRQPVSERVALLACWPW